MKEKRNGELKYKKGQYNVRKKEKGKITWCVPKQGRKVIIVRSNKTKTRTRKEIIDVEKKEEKKN